MTIADEVDRARREGVAREENLPFLIEPPRPCGAGVLLLHGFCASPWEMRLVGEELAGAGYLALGLRLPGHGTAPADLVGRNYEEWIEAAQRGTRLLAERVPRVYGLGLSTGGLLLLPLAEAGDLEAVVLLSPYLRLRHRLAPLAGWLRFFKRYQIHLLPPELSRYYYPLRPVSGVFQLYRLIRRVRKGLPRVSVPSLVISAAGDRTVNLESAFELYQRLGSTIKEHHLLGPEATHVLTTRENPLLEQTLGIVKGFLSLRENR